MSENLEIKSGIICDLIRREDNGKFIFIGVYSSDIRIKTFPATLPLCCVAIADIADGEFEIEFQVLFDGKELAAGKGRIGVTRRGAAIVPIQNILLTNLDAGTLRFQMREVNKEWQTILDIPVLPL